MNKSGFDFDYLRTKFPHTFDIKINGTIFISLQIRQLMMDENFIEKFNSSEKVVLLTLKK